MLRQTPNPTNNDSAANNANNHRAKTHALSGTHAANADRVEKTVAGWNTIASVQHATPFDTYPLVQHKQTSRNKT